MDTILKIINHPLGYTFIGGLLILIIWSLFRYIHKKIILKIIEKKKLKVVPNDISSETRYKITITLYAYYTCPQTSESYRIRKFLVDRNIPHIMKQIDNSKIIQDEIQNLSGQMEKPLLLANIGNKSQIRIIGYNEKELKRLFKEIIKLYKKEIKL